MKIVDTSGVLPPFYSFQSAEVTSISADLLLEDANAEWSETLRMAADGARLGSTTLWVGPYGIAVGGIVPPAVIGGTPWTHPHQSDTWDDLRARGLDRDAFTTEVEFMRAWSRNRAYINRCFRTPGAIPSGKGGNTQDPTGIFAALAVGFGGYNYYFDGQALQALVAQFLPVPADYSDVFGASYALTATSGSAMATDWASASFYTGTLGPPPGYMRFSCRYYDQLSVDTTSTKLFAIDVKKSALGFHPMGPLTGLHVAINQTTGTTALGAGTPRRYQVGACLVAHSVAGLGITGGLQQYFKGVNDVPNGGGQYTDALPDDSTSGGGIRAGLGTLARDKDNYLATLWAPTPPPGMTPVADVNNPFAYAGIRKYTGRLLHAFPRAGSLGVALMGPVSEDVSGDLLVDTKYHGFDWDPSVFKGLLSSDEGGSLDLGGRRVWSVVGNAEQTTRDKAFYDTYAGSLALENDVDVEGEVLFPASEEHELPSMTVAEANAATKGKKYRQLHFVYGTPEVVTSSRFFLRLTVGLSNNACALTVATLRGPTGEATVLDEANPSHMEMLDEALRDQCVVSVATTSAASCAATYEVAGPLFELRFGRSFDHVGDEPALVQVREVSNNLQWDETALYAHKPAFYTGVSHKRGYAELLNFARSREKLGMIPSSLVFFARRGVTRLKRTLQARGLPV